MFHKKEYLEGGGPVYFHTHNVLSCETKDLKYCLTHSPQANLWDKIAHTVVDGIYLNAAQCTNPSNFNTKVDISLKDWTDEELPNISVEVSKLQQIGRRCSHECHNTSCYFTVRMLNLSL